MQNLKFSLIVATLGRKSELILFLDSLLAQTISKSLFEVIIVDQNEENFLNNLLESYMAQLNITHIRSAQKGLSYNRNIGKKISKGEYLCVPDDDCIYYPDTLETVFTELEKYNNPEMIIGKVYNRIAQQHVFKKTPQAAHQVSVFNFYTITTSISLFFKNNEICFDEDFGVGSKYHSNEDGDLILSFLKEKKNVMYTPAIECNHPPYNSANTSNEKLYKYGIGFGAMCKKHLSVALIFLFLKVVAFQILMILRYAILVDKENCTRRWYTLKGRISGYFQYS